MGAVSESPTLRVAVGQFEVEPDVDANLDAVERLVESAAARGADLVVLPEASLWPIDGDVESLLSVATRVATDLGQELRALAARCGVALLVGVVEVAPDARKVFNTVLAVGSDGDVLGRYRKIHLYDAFGARESDRYVAGPLTPMLFRLHGFVVGLITCYDLRFPELARVLAERGADVIALPAAWAQGALKESHWTLLARARAVENTCYLAASGQCGPRYAGLSMVIDPLGTPLASLAETEGVVVADVERSRIDDVRTRLPVLANRRLGLETEAISIPALGR